MEKLFSSLKFLKSITMRIALLLGHYEVCFVRGCPFLEGPLSEVPLYKFFCTINSEFKYYQYLLYTDKMGMKEAVRKSIAFILLPAHSQVLMSCMELCVSIRKVARKLFVFL